MLTSLLAGGLSGAALLVASQAELGVGGFCSIPCTSTALPWWRVLAEPENTAIIVLCLCIGGLTNLIREAGGFNAVARKLVRRVKTRARHSSL